VAARLAAAQKAWDAAGPLSRDGRPLAERFARARDRVLEASPSSFRGTDLDVEGNREQRERLCERVESLVDDDPPAADEPAAASPAALLASRWREALAANTMGAPDPAAARAQARSAEVAAAQAAWDRIGPVPGDAGRALAERFRRACRQALGERRTPGARTEPPPVPAPEPAIALPPPAAPDVEIPAPAIEAPAPPPDAVKEKKPRKPRKKKDEPPPDALPDDTPPDDTAA
jgi:hypothetical protein